MSTTAELRALNDGRYVAYGSYSHSESAASRRPLESFFALRRAAQLLVFEGEFSSAGGMGKHAFTLEIELPENELGKGFFVLRSQSLGELKGVLGTTEGGLFILAGRSSEPPMQLSAQLRLQDEHHLSLHALLAYADDKWVTCSAAVKSYVAQQAGT